MYKKGVSLSNLYKHLDMSDAEALVKRHVKGDLVLSSLQEQTDFYQQLKRQKPSMLNELKVRLKELSIICKISNICS